MFHKGGNFELTLYQFSPWQLIKSFYSWLKSCWELQLVKDVVVCVRYGIFSGKRCLGSWDSLSTCKQSNFTILLGIAAPNISLPSSNGIEAASLKGNKLFGSMCFIQLFCCDLINQVQQCMERNFTKNVTTGIACFPLCLYALCVTTLVELFKANYRKISKA